MNVKHYHQTIAGDSSEFVELAGKTVKLQYLEHNGARVADAAVRIKQLAEGSEVEEQACVRMWLRWEFNLPATLRAHCLSCFIKVMPNEEFVAGIHGPQMTLFTYREREYRLHWQSNMSVCMTAPLVAVSFRITPEGEYFAVAQVWAVKPPRSLNHAKE